MGQGVNMSKTSEVLQRAEESPSRFYERLCETSHFYTSFDPEVPVNQQMVSVAFVGEVQGNIQ